MKIFLLVDDSPVIRKVANRILTDMGFVVVEAADGFEALEKCRYNMPDAVLIDWDTPNMTGIEFLEQFSAIEGSKEARIMVSDMTKAKRAGANAFMMKPFNRKILQTKLKEAGVEIDKTASVAA
ncbi:Chemotaxis protein CheY [Nymphon striatum]|nr:Chemotaxis protein CheY [Nymphon striatum]